jgi:hypothetical protein
VGSNLIRTILLQSPHGDLGIEPNLLTDVESLKSFISGQEVPFEVGYFSDMVFIDGRGLSLLRFGNVDGEGPNLISINTSREWGGLT